MIKRKPRIDYWAGWLDGEGCFQYYGTTSISCSNSYKPNLDRLAKRFGGTVRPRKPNKLSCKPMFEWTVTGERSRKACRELIPYLVEKREQAEILTRIMEYPKKSMMRKVMNRELKGLKHREAA